MSENETTDGAKEFEAQVRQWPVKDLETAQDILGRVAAEKTGTDPLADKLRGANDQEFHKIAAEEIRKADRARAKG